MAISKEYIVKLKGKDYPMWAGVLHAATEAGLLSIITTLVQIPSAENGMMAVVTARAEFKDGRVFTGIGDCSPASTTPHLVPACLRLAETRAKGRALRDALDIGETMYEEIPDDEQPQQHSSAKPVPNQQTRAERPAPNVATPPAAPPATVDACGECGTIVSADEAKMAPKYAEQFKGRVLCHDCGRKAIAAYKAERPA